MVVARLLRALDGAPAPRPRQLHRDDPAEGLRKGQAEVPQGRNEGRGEVLAQLALQSEAIDLLERIHVRPELCRGLHRALGPAVQDSRERDGPIDEGDQGEDPA